METVAAMPRTGLFSACARFLVRASFHNLKGDIAAFLDSSGSRIVEYRYHDPAHVIHIWYGTLLGGYKEGITSMKILIPMLRHSFYFHPITESTPDCPKDWFDPKIRRRRSYRALCEKDGVNHLSREALLERGLIPFEPCIPIVDIERDFLRLYGSSELREHLLGIDNDKEFDIAFRTFIDHRDEDDHWNSYLHDITMKSAVEWVERNNIPNCCDSVPPVPPEIEGDFEKTSEFRRRYARENFEDIDDVEKFVAEFKLQRESLPEATLRDMAEKTASAMRTARGDDPGDD